MGNAKTSSVSGRVGLSVAFAALLVLISPARHTHAAEVGWYPGGDFGSPAYTMPITVYDATAPTIKPEYRPIWRQARERALAEWSASGCVRFNVLVRKPSWLPYPWTTENVDQGLAITDVRPDAILMVRSNVITSDGQGSWIESEGGGITIYNPGIFWWRYHVTRFVIAHETGHALGFGHGGSGVMGGNDHVSAGERAAVCDYYGAA